MARADAHDDERLVRLTAAGALGVDVVGAERVRAGLGGSGEGIDSSEHSSERERRAEGGHRRNGKADLPAFHRRNATKTTHTKHFHRAGGGRSQSEPQIGLIIAICAARNMLETGRNGPADDETGAMGPGQNLH